MVVPADIRLIRASNLLVNGSILLGKQGIRMGDAVGGGEYLMSTNMVFQGFTIETGKAIGVVLKTGPRTILSQSINRTSNLSSFEFKWILLLGSVWAAGLCWQKFVQKEIVYEGFLALCMVLTKFPQFIIKGRQLGMLTTSHLMISEQVYPKTITSHEVLSKVKYLVYDIRDVVVTNRKEVKKIYVGDSLRDVQDLKKQEGDYEKLLNLTYFATYKEKKMEEVAGADEGGIEDFDPSPKEPEYNHPIELILREFISGYNLPEIEHVINAKVPLSGKNRNSLTVITPKSSDPQAILVGEASEILKSSKLMYVAGTHKELPIRTLSHMCEELTLQGHICIAVAYSDIPAEVIKEKKELTADIFDFSLCGIYIIREFTEDASSVVPLAQELGITLIGIGKDTKEYLLNLSNMSNLITEAPQEYKNQSCNPGEAVVFTPSQVVKNYKATENLCCFVPGLSIFDTAYLLNQMRGDLTCYVGQNHIALQVSDVGVSMVANSPEVKNSSNFVLLSQTPLVDLLKCIKSLRNFGNYDFFFMQECVGCFIPSICYFIVVYFMQGSISSLGILLVDFAIPLSSQFLWMGFPKNSYSYPLQAWLLITMAGLYNYFHVYALGYSWMACNFAYFFTVFTACLLKVLWLQVWNFKKKRVSWVFVYALLGIKLGLFSLFCVIRMVASRNDLEAVGLQDLAPGIAFYIVLMFSLKIYNF